MYANDTTKKLYTYKHPNGRENTYSVISTNPQDIEFLFKLGLTERKSLKISYPNILAEFDKDFIRGYFDGDGCFSVTKRNDRKNPNSKTYQFNITGMEGPLSIIQQHLVDNVGIVKNSLKKRVSTVAVTIHYGGRGVCKKILDYLYDNATIYLQRKYNKYKKYCTSAE